MLSIKPAMYRNLNSLHIQSYKKSFTFLHKTRLIIQPCLWQVIILIITNDRWLDMFNNMKWSIWIEGAVASNSFPVLLLRPNERFDFSCMLLIYVNAFVLKEIICHSSIHSFPRNKGLTRHATDDNMSNRVLY